MNETQPAHEIRIQGHIAPRRFRQFEDLTVTHLPNGETVLVIPGLDQSALNGLLSWLKNIGVLLLSVKRLENKV